MCPQVTTCGICNTFPVEQRCHSGTVNKQSFFLPVSYTVLHVNN